MIKEEVYKFFAELIFKNSGMVYSPADYYRLDSRITELTKALGLAGPDELHNAYKTNLTPDKLSLLINLSTNNETYFFRDTKPFSALVKTILPEVLTKNENKNIKIWSAACSTGQEAFSILMASKKNLSVSDFDRLSIDGSDISKNALEKAKAATYSALDVQRGLPVQMLVSNFQQVEPEKWVVDSSLRSKVNFFEFNLLSGMFKANHYDVVFCRNILIYQNKENKQKILRSIYDSLKDGGYLVMGAGENLLGMDTKFSDVQFDDFHAFKKSA